MRKVFFSLMLFFLMSAVAFAQALIPVEYQGKWSITARMVDPNTVIPFENPITIQVESDTITILDDPIVVKNVLNVSSMPYGDNMDYIITFKDSKTEWDLISIKGNYFLAIINKEEHMAAIFVVEKVPTSPTSKSVWRNST